MLADAIAYGASGLRVFPCRPSDKRPFVKWTELAATDAHEIGSLFARFPDALIGLCTGGGLVVIDDDRGLAEPTPQLIHTLTARTRSRGFHHYFRCAEAIPCSVGKVAPGVDVRGDGGYVIAPPSPGWEWLNPDAGLAELPAELRSAALRYSPQAGIARPRFVEREVVDEGGRNDYIASYVGWLLRLDDEIEDVVELALHHNAEVCVPPLPEDEVRRTARSIARRHYRR